MEPVALQHSSVDGEREPTAPLAFCRLGFLPGAGNPRRGRGGRVRFPLPPSPTGFHTIHQPTAHL